MAFNRIGMITRTYGFVQRYRQILFVLLKYGFDDLIAKLKVDQYLEVGWLFGPKKNSSVKTLSRAERIRLSIEELGPTFIKMGQMLSTRSDLLPEDILQELCRLQDEVPSFPVEKARAIIRKELGKDVEEVFAEFNDKPLAAGSIGQVHLAKLKDGQEVAVKVQRPKIRASIDTDLEIIHHMATLMEHQMEMGQIHKPTKIVDEFGRTLRQELDYTMEAANIERFAKMHEADAHVYVHRIFRECSTGKIITTQYVRGIKPDSVGRLERAGLSPTSIARSGAELVMGQIFFHGFFHADPHPGNLLVLEGNLLCFLDFGMMGRLDRQSREIFAELILNIIQRNEVKATDAVLKLTHSHALVDRLSLEREISELIDQYLYRPLKELEIGKIIRQLMDLTVKHELQIPAQFFLLIKSISQIESLGRDLDPDFDLTERAGPYIRKLLMNRYHPKRVMRDFYETGSDLVYLLKEVPGELRELLKQAKQGQIKMEMKHAGLRPMQNTLSHLSNRISSAIVLAAIIVGSSLIIHSKIPPYWHGIPIIGLAGFLASGVMGLILLRSIWKGKIE